MIYYLFGSVWFGSMWFGSKRTVLQGPAPMLYAYAYAGMETTAIYVRIESTFRLFSFFFSVLFSFADIGFQ